MSKVLQERRFGSLPSSTETNPRDQVKSISTSKADFYEIHRMDYGSYVVSGPQHRYIFPETVSFPWRLYNYCCDDLKEVRGVKILDAYVHNLPQKEKDPWTFTLPCFINNVRFDKSLVDLGESVGVMPFSTYTNHGLGILSHTRLTIELADRTIKQPRDIIKNVIVRIGKFVFPIDFIILDIPEDDDVPLILGRPFLSTTHSKIDVFKRKITLRVGKEKLIFKSIKPATSIIKMEVILFYNGLDVLPRQILDSKGAIPSKTTADAKVAIQEMAELSQKWHNETSSKSIRILSHTRLTIELADRTIKQPRDIIKNVIVRIGKFVFPIDFIILDIPEDDDVPLILGRPFLSTAYSKIDVFKRKITLRVGKEKLIFKSIKPATSIIKMVFMSKYLDLKIELIGEGDESFDPMYGFTIIDDNDDIIKGVKLGMPFFKKYLSCQMIMKKFAHRDECERIEDE
nr:hypothetical protein [Tanacetum cinerariifolium]